MRLLQADSGFSLVELLIVIVLLAILAAIALPQFIGQTAQGRDASAKSDVRTVATAVEHCFTETNDYAECDSQSQLELSGLSWGTANGQVQVISSAEREFAVRAFSHSGHHFTWTRPETGGVERSCSPSGEGGCNSDGAW
jgi:prepilin-type N-terminal cleavage/methylation domain-containing protein